MEGYWWSGKFWRDEVSGGKGQAWIGRVMTYLACISSLEETGTSVEDCRR